MENITPIAILLSYWLTIGLLAKWCVKKEQPTYVAFAVGAITCVISAGLVLGISSIYHEKLMLINNSLAMTLFLFAGLAIMGGWRCTDRVKKASRSE